MIASETMRSAELSIKRGNWKTKRAKVEMGKYRMANANWESAK